jgi:site-specific DNA-methyltransferase (adenine-specific)
MNTSGGGAVMGSFPYPRNGILKIDYEFILIFKKPGKAPKPTAEQKKKSEIPKEEWKEYFASHWNFNGVRQMDHIAMFPEELPKRLIKMFSFVGETVFDPFGGSGTTSLAAKNLGRNSVLYEINKDFAPIIKEKLLGEQINVFEHGVVSFTEDDSINTYSYDDLPYVFKDPHALDKKVDVKKLQFGSKIDGSEKGREEKFTVKEVLSPEELLLSNGLKIKLLGVIEKPEYREEAIAFLKEKFNKRRVYLKYDELKYNDKDQLMCYVYLDNRTFINNHLVKTGFVNVDVENEYMYKQKFLKSFNAVR